MNPLEALVWAVVAGLVVVVVVAGIVVLVQRRDPSFYVAPEEEARQWRP